MVKKSSNPYRFLNEGPEVVGLISSVLENNGSIDTAARLIASSGPPYSASIFKKVVDDADLRICSDIENAIYRSLSALPEQCIPYGMAMRMAISASRSTDSDERRRVLKEASDIALSGLKDIGKTFSASLNTPCMVIFGIGIMVPMILMSIIPMMGITGVFGGSALDTRTLAVLTLVLIPCIILLVISGINGRNPLRQTDCEKDILPALALLSFIPIFLVLSGRIPDLPRAIAVSLIASSLIALCVSLRDSRKKKIKNKTAKLLDKSVFEIGNRLISGSDFELAVSETLVSRSECEHLGRRFSNEVAISRGDVPSSIVSTFGSISKTFTETLLNVFQTSRKDPIEAGKLAMSLGRKNEDKETLRRNIRNELKNMTDTMFGTAAVFAPLVLGLSMSMMEPMKAISDAVETDGTSLILTIYLSELCALISILLSMIEGRCNITDVIRRFTLMTPVSLAVFLVSSGISL